MVTKGYAAPEVEQAYARARELCQQVGRRHSSSEVLRGLWYFYLQRVELQTARRARGATPHPGPAASAPGISC